jgi:hypothetical protein
MTTQSDDPIVEYQARAIIELEAHIRSLEEQRHALEATIAELRSLIAVFERSRAVRLANALQDTSRNLRQWARSRMRKIG